MSLIEKEKELLCEISGKKYSEAERKSFFGEKELESYYSNPITVCDEYLQEYEFGSVDEVKAVLKILFSEKEIPMEYLMPVLVAMMKLRNNTERKEVLMDSIYNF